MIPPDIFLTPSAVRTLCRVANSCQTDDLAEFAGQLVIALFDDESMAGSLLRSAGLSAAIIGYAVTQPAANSSVGMDFRSTDDVTAADMIRRLPENPGRIVAEARRIARLDLRTEGISSEHLLAATLQFNTPVCRTLQQHDVTPQSVLANCSQTELSAEPIPVPFTLETTPKSSEHNDSCQSRRIASAPSRVLDACMNRAREGMRVLEDYARFIMNDGTLVRDLKELRHRLAAWERKLITSYAEDGIAKSAVAERDVAGDVGTSVTGAQEQVRRQLLDIVHANARRVQESLRSLEEFGKLIGPSFSDEVKQLRYQSYEIHQNMLLLSGVVPDCTVDRRHRLQSAHICVLVSEEGCCHPWKQVVESCLMGNADMIQLREKHLVDRELLTRAKWLTQACHASGVLCIINDRSDIAHLSGADGVHLGQNDCSVTDARRLVGADCLIGLSTHNTKDIESAHAQSVDYLGVGPVFPSVTKEFDRLAGVELLRKAATVTLPWFAIGGIDQQNIHDVAETGTSRIAVSSSVIASQRPDDMLQMLRQQLISV